MRAHDLTIKEVDKSTERDFLLENHYQGYVNSAIAYGLYNNNELMEIITFGKPRFNKAYQWELLRLCTKKDEIVYGGASKLFKHFIQNNDISGGVISYCNRDKFTGKVYTQLGFTSKGITKGYHYEKDGVKYNRTVFTKANCLKKWPEYKEKTYYSERMIMAEQGYERVEDKIGQELFVYNDPCKYYIYKLTFEDGATYIGSHIEYAPNDNYITSSFYAKDHKIKQRDILLYVNDKQTLYLLETIAIMDDKCNSNKNVNGNLGNYIFTHVFNFSYRKNYRWSSETREKQKAARMGHICKDSTKQKISKANKGKKRSKEMCEKMRQIVSGRRWWNNGIINKQSKECPGEGFVLGRIFEMPDSAKERLSKVNKGKHHTEETKRKISEASKRIPFETRSKVNKGRKFSEEHKKAIADSIKKHWELRRCCTNNT